MVDDGSPVPPAKIVAEFPSVTLLTAPATVGPYRLVQQVIQDTVYDYYLFQDADDWSLADRLAYLLAAAEHTQADLIGTQELRWESEPGHLISVHYPLDVNLALAEKPGHPLLHPTSLVRRQLVMKVGGFATGLRFGGDTEFLLRAAWIGRILNLPSYGYLRQKRLHSLTTAPHTGLDSPLAMPSSKPSNNGSITTKPPTAKASPLTSIPSAKPLPFAFNTTLAPL